MNIDKNTNHVAGIIPVAGLPLEFNFPWHDCLMPIHSDYHAVERAIHTAALAGCNTIWLVLHREAQPIIRRKVGEWVYDPEFVWVENSFFQKREIPVYYIPITGRDRRRRDSHAWSSLYGSKIASYVCSKISKWVKPTKYFVVSPYGVIDDDTARLCKELLKKKENFYVANGDQNFKTEGHMPFSYGFEEWDKCRVWNWENYSHKEGASGRKWAEVFEPVDLSNYKKVDAGWAYNISDWAGYHKFIASEHNLLCQKPKHLVSHKWHGLNALK